MRRDLHNRGVIVMMVVAAIAPAVRARTRAYAGPVQTTWQTVGKHGHDQPPCAVPRVTEFPGSILE
jgi:hypothetical protein